ncbi:DUF4367 domain-containing protein [Lachnospiraceae bacterium AM25-11LB]|jgi:hypothetical protein|uniref:DUF4367 domain-containing protein n=1 Tax=Blautia hansenii TaxID=1322 RepID=UPI000E3EE85B|nr:DUF4367 domain-containing protein [Lachnospiraceae bacterium AM25-22]RGD08420.1 DUF4367 domain-containing protein [Lachnospiraceae bacterium AM25-11LB]RJW12215.1 DUF4367 domain-containing protein [Lachnospiraceae bacterium AM25-40]RJW16170.1 DUF4367 domain-containing protein [Lachnospiraceae bacterium AM25-39]
MGKSEENEKKCETFFTENLNDEELNQKILEEFLKEAEEIEKEAEEISKSLECEPTEDGFQKLMAEIRRRESIENTNNYVTNVDDREKHTNKVKELKNAKWYKNKSNTKQGNTGRKRVVRWASVAAAVLIGVFGISMTSEANRAYIMREMNELFGNDVNTQVDNNDVIKSDRTERYACEEIENILDIKMPRFFYLPDELKYQTYSLDEEAGAGILQYSYGEQMIFLTAFLNETKASVLNQNDNGVLIDTFQNDFIPELKITLWKIEEKEDKAPIYALKWEYKNSYYEFFGEIKEKEMENIAKNIMY